MRLAIVGVPIEKSSCHSSIPRKVLSFMIEEETQLWKGGHSSYKNNMTAQTPYIQDHDMTSIAP